MSKIQFFIILAMTILSSGSHSLLAQTASHHEKLPWVRGEYPEKQRSYEYMVARGEGKTLSEARDNAINDLLIELGNNAGVKVNSSTISEMKDQLKFDGKTTDYSETTTNTSVFKINREGFNASFSKVSEYYEYTNGVYQLWELYEVSQSGKNFKPDIPQFTDQYGASAALRSALLPGWGQFHKGKTGKGILFLTTEIVSLSGLVFCEMRRSDNIRLSQETTNLTIIKEYRSRADTWTLRRNILIGSSLGIYAWNVLDAALAKGKIRYAWIPNNINLIASEDFGNYYCGVSFNF